MKRFLIVIAIAVLFVSCGPQRLRERPSENDLPRNFVFVQDEGNGYFMYKSPEGKFLVSIQKQGELKLGTSNKFVDIIFVGD